MGELREQLALELPLRGQIPATNAEDPVDYYYKPIIGALYRSRLRLAADLLGPGPFASALDVGYGSGIFFPELGRRAERLVGVDVHGEEDKVASALRALGVDVELHAGSVLDLPFADGEFDAVVCLSVLEHLRGLERALDELHRVLVPGGIAVIGFPVRQPITDLFFRVAGHDPRALHPSSHTEILTAVRTHARFAVERVARFPRRAPLGLSAYAGCRCRAV